jgi:transposase
MTLEAKFGQHLPLNRQSETFARVGIELDVGSVENLGQVAAIIHGSEVGPV